MVEGAVIVKVTVAAVPDAGTLPDPDQPVQRYLVPPDSSAGLVTEAVTDVPELYQVSPTAGLGES